GSPARSAGTRWPGAPDGPPPQWKPARSRGRKPADRAPGPPVRSGPPPPNAKGTPAESPLRPHPRRETGLSWPVASVLPEGTCSVLYTSIVHERQYVTEARG